MNRSMIICLVGLTAILATGCRGPADSSVADESVASTSKSLRLHFVGFTKSKSGAT